MGEMVLRRAPGAPEFTSQEGVLLTAGHPRPEIARRLEISEHTAVTHTRQIFEKFEVHNRSELLIKLMGM